jgi:hypothetical protein
MVRSVEVGHVISTLIDEWGVDTPRKINRGNCALFAVEVAERCPSLMLVKTGNEPVSGRISLDDVSEPAHIWVTDGKKHYDVEVPEGVNDWKNLPVFERTLSGDQNHE